MGVWTRWSLKNLNYLSKFDVSAELGYVTEENCVSLCKEVLRYRRGCTLGRGGVDSVERLGFCYLECCECSWARLVGTEQGGDRRDEGLICRGSCLVR